MKLPFTKYLCALGVAGAFCMAPANADIIMSYAATAGVETSSVVNSSIFTFDTFPTSKVSTNVTIPIDNATTATVNKVYVLAANEYGGAADALHPNGSAFPVQSNGGEGNVVTSTLTLNNPINYFGLWWSAGDVGNYLYFYNGTNLLAELNTAYLKSVISSAPAYFGNPDPGSNHGKDSSEPFAFVNFFDVGGLGITSLVLSNPASSGFESDNWTFRTAAYGTDPSDGPTLPGILVEDVSGTSIVAKYTSDSPPYEVIQTPEPSVLWLASLGVIGFIIYQRKHPGLPASR